jgi:hypothetical protein
MSTEHPELWTGDRGKAEAKQFGRYSDRDEQLHPEASIPGDTLTETWAYMWYIPEERISAMIHLWVHPNLDVVTAGIGVWRGHKGAMQAAELMDVRTFLSAKEIGNGLDMTFPQGLHVEILEPFKKMRIRYEDKARRNALDLIVTDFSPPVMRGSEVHFDQATHNKGTLTLRGKSYKVDSYGMRDRSWGQLRPEALMPTPPFTWMTGTFPQQRIAWNVSAFDDPTRDPVWKGLFDVKREDTIHDAWLWRDEQLYRLENVSKITRHDPVTMSPRTHEIDFRDPKGRDYHITGKVIASVPWVSWSNMVCHVCLTEWKCDGMIGYGDTQECQWNDFVHALRKDQDIPPER